MRVLIKKWGNNASVRIPAPVMAAAHVALDQPVDVREEGGQIIVEPIQDQTYDLDTLLAGITDDNIHSEVDFGPPVGKEMM